MQKLLEEKFKEYKAFAPDNSDLRTWIDQSNVWGWVYSAFRLQGDNFSKGSVVDMVEGRLRDDMPLSAYSFVHGYEDVYKDMKMCLGMQATLDIKMVTRWAQILKDTDITDKMPDVYRQSAAVIYEWEYIPPDTDVEKELDNLLRRTAAENHGNMSLKDTVLLYLSVCRLHPFGDNSIRFNQLILMYGIMSLGYPLPELPIDDREYNTLIAEYLENGNPSAFFDMVERAVYNRLEAVVNLCKHVKENEELNEDDPGEEPKD